MRTTELLVYQESDLTNLLNLTFLSMELRLLKAKQKVQSTEILLKKRKEKKEKVQTESLGAI